VKFNTSLIREVYVHKDCVSREDDYDNCDEARRGVLESVFDFVNHD
jgi:hypothetical protein